MKNGKTPAGRQRYRCFAESGCGYSTTAPKNKVARSQSGRKAERIPTKIVNRALGDATRFIVTAAQNATPVNRAFLASLERYASDLGAELVVIPLRYKNATSQWTESQANAEWWDESVAKYLYNGRKKLNENLVLLGDVKTQPTATRPLSGFEGMTGSESCILGHTRLQFTVIPAPANRFPKILTTTGAVTVPNYTDSKAGKLGEFHHVYGACIVDIVGKKFHMRQLLADRDGSFTDLDLVWSGNGFKMAPPALVLAMGDTHHRFIDKGVERATFGKEGIVDTLNPQYLVWHDLLDDYAANPHHDGNPFIEAAKRTKGFQLVKREVEEAIEFLDRMTGARKSIVVSSNHDDFLRRWIIKTDWREDIENAEFYLDTAKAMLASAVMGKGGAEYASPFDYWIKRLSKNPNVRVLGADESFAPGRVECGMHGHRGPNGARGSVRNLSRLGTRVVSGHGHTPGIEEGHMRVGTSTPLRLEYTEGPSSWLNTHGVIYANGKRTLITIIDGEWRR